MATFDSITSALTAQSILHGRKQAAREREKIVDLAANFYQGSFHEAIVAGGTSEEAILRFGFKDYKNILPFFQTRLVKDTIDQLSMTYKKPPARNLVNEDGDPLDENEYGRWIEDHPDFNIMMRQAERYSNLLSNDGGGNVLLRFEYDDATDEFWFFLNYHYVPYFASNNRLKPIGYSIPLLPDISSTRVEDPKWLFISDEEMFIHNNLGPDVKLEDVFTEGGNPYGMMPIIDFTIPDPDSYWKMVSPVVSIAQAYLVGMMDIFAGIHFQSFDQPWIEGIEHTDADHFKVGANKSWAIPEGASAGLLNFNPKLTETIDVLVRWMNMELSAYGMKMSFREAGNPQSGFALRVEKEKLLEYREDQLPFLRMKEQRVFKIVSKMIEVHELDYRIPQNAELSIDFAEPEFPKTPDEERSQVDWEVERNLTTYAEYQANRDDVPLEQAEAQLQENQEKNNLQRSRGVGIFRQIAQNGNQFERIQQ